MSLCYVMVFKTFCTLIESAAKATQQECPRIVLFGECVGLLYTLGHLDAAIALENAGNTLIERYNQYIPSISYAGIHCFVGSKTTTISSASVQSIQRSVLRCDIVFLLTINVRSSSGWGGSTQLVRLLWGRIPHSLIQGVGQRDLLIVRPNQSCTTADR